MSKRPYFEQYQSPNIVIVPTVSLTCEPPTKEPKLHKSLPTELVQENCAIIQPQTISKLRENCVDSVLNSPKSLQVPPPNDSVAPIESDITHETGENRNSRSVEDLNVKAGIACTSWATNYLMSIGQLHKTPIKINVAPRRLNSTKEETASISSTKDTNYLMSIVSTTSNESVERSSTLLCDAKPVENAATVSQNTPRDANYSLTQLSEVNNFENRNKNKAYNTLQNKTHASCYTIKEPTYESKTINNYKIGNQKYSPDSENDRLIYKTKTIPYKIPKLSSAISREHKYNDQPNRTSESSKAYAYTQKYKNTCLENNDKANEMTNKTTQPKESFNDLEDYKSGMKRPAENINYLHHKTKITKNYTYSSDSKNIKSNTKSSCHHKLEDKSKSHKYKSNSTPSTDAKGEYSKVIPRLKETSNSSKSKKYYKITNRTKSSKEMSECKYDSKKCKNSPAKEAKETNLQKDKKKDKSKTIDRESERKEKSVKDTNKLKIKSKTSMEIATPSQTRLSSSKHKSLSTNPGESKQPTPIKSIVQVTKHFGLTSPIDKNYTQIEKTFDLRTKLSHRNLSNYFNTRNDKMTIFTKQYIEKIPNDQREKLVITVENEKESEDISSDTNDTNDTNDKGSTVVKYHKIKLVINLVCEKPSPCESTNDENTISNEDLSFLDDFNVDEIVETLVRSENVSERSGQDSEVNIDLGGMDCIKSVNITSSSIPVDINESPKDDKLKETESDGKNLGISETNKTIDLCERAPNQNIMNNQKEIHENSENEKKLATIKTEVLDSLIEEKFENHTEEVNLSADIIKKEIDDLEPYNANNEKLRETSHNSIEMVDKITDKTKAFDTTIEEKSEKHTEEVDLSTSIFKKEIMDLVSSNTNSKVHEELSETSHFIKMQDKLSNKTKFLNTAIKNHTDDRLASIIKKEIKDPEPSDPKLMGQLTDKSSVNINENPNIQPLISIKKEPGLEANLPKDISVKTSIENIILSERKNIKLAPDYSQAGMTKSRIQPNEKKETFIQENNQRLHSLGTEEPKPEAAIDQSEPIFIQDDDSVSTLILSPWRDNDIIDLTNEISFEKFNVAEKNELEDFKNVLSSYENNESVTLKTTEGQDRSISCSTTAQKSESTATVNNNEVADDKKTKQTSSSNNTENNKNLSKDNPQPLLTNNEKTDENKTKAETNSKSVKRESISVDEPIKMSLHLPLTVLANKLEVRMFKYLRAKFTLDSVIHEGRFSNIYRCKTNKGAYYAVKIIKNESDRYYLGIMKEEILVNLRRDIPKESFHCAYVYTGFSLGARWCLLMDYYPKTLAQVLEEKNKPFHIDIVQHLTRQLVTAVAVLRNHNIIHSDIKPSHILLNNSSSNLKLCGFDEAHFCDSVKLVPNIGTVNYRAPEVILGYSSGFSIDVWATALVIYEMATNVKLFPGVYNNDILFKQLCTLGPVTFDMIQHSLYSRNHFRGKRFVRRVGPKGQERVIIRNFYKNNRLKTSLNKAYAVNWAAHRSKQQKVKDKSKIESLFWLLEKMLVMHPRHRLTIEFVYANPFIFESYDF